MWKESWCWNAATQNECYSLKVILTIPCPLVMLDCVSVTYLYQIRYLILALRELQHDWETRMSKGLELVLAAAPSFILNLIFFSLLGDAEEQVLLVRSIWDHECVLKVRWLAKGDDCNWERLIWSYPQDQAEGGNGSTGETSSIFCTLRNQIFRLSEASVSKEFFLFSISFFSGLILMVLPSV